MQVCGEKEFMMTILDTIYCGNKVEIQSSSSGIPVCCVPTIYQCFAHLSYVLSVPFPSPTPLQLLDSRTPSGRKTQREQVLNHMFTSLACCFLAVVNYLQLGQTDPSRTRERDGKGIWVKENDMSKGEAGMVSQVLFIQLNQPTFCPMDRKPCS